MLRKETPLIFAEDLRAPERLAVLGDETWLLHPNGLAAEAQGLELWCGAGSR